MFLTSEEYIFVGVRSMEAVLLVHASPVAVKGNCEMI